MKFKKYIGIVLIACMLISAMFIATACDGGNTEENKKTQDKEKDTVTEKATDDKPSENNTQQPTEQPSEDNTQQPTEKPTDNVTDGEKIDYSLEFVDYKGNTVTSMSGVMSLSNGQIAPIANGKASFKAEKGDYSATFELSDHDYKCDDFCDFTEEITSVRIPVYNKVTDTNKDFYKSENGAGYVHPGATYVKLRGVTSDAYEGERSYFIFRPTRDGIYNISVISDNFVEVGYYGGTVINVYDNSLIPAVDNVVEYSIRKSSITTGDSAVCVIGLTTDGSAKDCVLVIERVADMPLSTEDLEWIVPTIEKELTPIKLSYHNKNVVLTNLDLMSPDLKLVMNESDGYYHLGTADGPIVYVRLSATIDYFGFDPETNAPNLASFTTIIDTSRMCRYFFDEEGNPIRKESYNQIILAYKEMLDASGVYPLDEMLEYVIKQHGEYVGWWDSESSNNLYSMYGMSQPPVENAWLFAACIVTVEDKGTDGESALLVNPEGATSLVGASDTFYYNVNEKSNSISVELTVNAAEGISVEYDGQVYTADENGVITVTIGETRTFCIKGSADMSEPVEVVYTYAYI
ncbi:MAG: hypothetical protein E7667_00900 [Ruminococcaceae bacterium]|nr:hypothetical protein [Oscillospiraceae bacterium]